MSYKQEFQSNNTDLQQILDKVNTLPDAITLPTLSNPAGAANIESGYEALDGNGNKIEGSLVKQEIVQFTKTASSQSMTSLLFPELVGKENFIITCIKGSAVAYPYYSYIETIVKRNGVLSVCGIDGNYNWHEALGYTLDSSGKFTAGTDNYLYYWRTDAPYLVTYW